MKKLLLVIPTLDRSGAEKQCVLLATHLPRDEFDVHVAVLTRKGSLADELDASGVPYTLINKSRKFDPFAFRRLVRLIQRVKPDIVHTWLFAGNAYGRYAAMVCNVPRIIASERCVDSWKTQLYFKIDRYLARFTERITTNSNGVVNFYEQNGIAADKFRVIPNAVLLPQQTDVDGTREQLDSEFELSPLTPVNDEPYIAVSETGFVPPTQPMLIGIVARLWKQKRIDEMIWVFESLRFSGINFHTLIIGDGPEREELLRYRDSKRLSDCVHFLGHRRDVPRFMPHFDVLLCPSAYEGQSNSILEAMSYGVPVIASNIPGNDELVVHNETGLLIPEHGNDYRTRRADYVRDIIYLYEHPEYRRQLGNAARERVTNNFTLQAMINNHAALYNE
jgi:glycosyltransferase involved in cell wall biosynthesis